MTGRKVGTTEQREVGKWERVGSISNAHGGGVVAARCQRLGPWGWQGSSITEAHIQYVT